EGIAEPDHRHAHRKQADGAPGRGRAHVAAVALVPLIAGGQIRIVGVFSLRHLASPDTAGRPHESASIFLFELLELVPGLVPWRSLSLARPRVEPILAPGMPINLSVAAEPTAPPAAFNPAIAAAPRDAPACDAAEAAAIPPLTTPAPPAAMPAPTAANPATWTPLRMASMPLPTETPWTTP